MLRSNNVDGKTKRVGEVECIPLSLLPKVICGNKTIVCHERECCKEREDMIEVIGFPYWLSKIKDRRMQCLCDRYADNADAANEDARCDPYPKRQALDF